MKRGQWSLAPAVLVAAAIAFAGCKSEPLGPSGSRPTTGHAGASGTAATNGGGGAFNAGGAPGGLGGFGAGGFAGGSVPGGAAGAGGCLESRFESTVAEPDILIVLNRSAAMGLGADGQSCSTPGCPKWAQIVAAVEAVMAATPSYNYGLMYFGAGTTACGVPENPRIGVGPGGAAGIPGEIGLLSLAGAAPVAGTIRSAEGYLRGLGDLGSKYILLATDGAPTCGANDPDGTMDDSGDAQAAMENAASWGIESFVLGVADPADTHAVATLNAMAIAGWEQQVGAATSYFDATTGVPALERALSGLHQRYNCATTIIPIPVGAPPGGPFTVTITQGGEAQVVPYDPTGTTGWSYSDSNQNGIILDGPFCSALDALGETIVDVRFDCGTDPGTLL
jgi:hypothetical protein